MKRSIRIHSSDNVGVALTELKKGEKEENILLLSDIPRGHKFALKEIAAEENVIKYGLPIGHATTKIMPGEHVHTHNVRTNLDGLLEYSYEDGKVTLPPMHAGKSFFMGYRRADGRAGVRNNLWIVPTVGCVNALAQSLARTMNHELPEDSGIRAVALTHPCGCSQLGTDHEMTRSILAGLVKHPNAGGVLVLGLGCENNTPESFREILKPYDETRIRFLVAQKVQDEYGESLKILRELASLALSDKREKIPASELVIGLKCGGSDGLSGITANPLAGRFSDRLLLQEGGCTILSEVPEMFGAETILMKRCVNRSVFNDCVKMINGFKEYFMRYNQVVYENPSPGNKAGGITTLEDKSMGCTQKAGSAPVSSVLQIGEAPRTHGLHLLTGPGNDMAATTLLSASGAHIILFTTGRGTPFGGVVPTLKISSNTALAENKRHWIDFDAGKLVSSEIPSETIDQEFFDLVLSTASGKYAHNEERGFEEIAIFKDGVTL